MNKNFWNRLLSLTVCLAMMCAAALAVNKTLAGKTPTDKAVSKQSSVEKDTAVSTMEKDGTMVVHTRELTDVAGYAGPVPLDVYFKEGRIVKVVALKNAETPAFFDRASALLSAWTGKTASEARTMKVDAVSGATYSSNAIITNVRAAASYIEKKNADGKEALTMPWKEWVALGVVLCACILPLFVRNKWYRIVQLMANVAVLGFWCGQFLDYSLMLKYLSSGFVWPIGLTAVAMLIAAFIYPLFGRPQHYCNHICPLGSAQLLVADLCGYKLRLSGGVIKCLDWFRRILWGVLMILLWADVATEWLDFELFRAFMVESAPVGILLAAGAFVLLSAVVARPYCRFVCPTGSLIKRAENLG